MLKEVVNNENMYNSRTQYFKKGACTSADGVVNEYQYNKSLAPVLADTFRKEGHKVDNMPRKAV
ncbi:N-acetylmuramoyl-L-alanine amidase domain protein [Clostridioides difficile DA00130]|nr:hypothetical protein [Clostridioides difficile]EQG53155.1 N-acetylmuramoyl-L-alanine amidase domain protein [Clostridioides difficile DA00131]ERM22454.1 N-acetylmuramoyl-L-alanine amidase domain protein [Clostridioides difficile DA00130]